MVFEQARASQGFIATSHPCTKYSFFSKPCAFEPLHRTECHSAKFLLALDFCWFLASGGCFLARCLVVVGTDVVSIWASPDERTRGLSSDDGWDLHQEDTLILTLAVSRTSPDNSRRAHSHSFLKDSEGLYSRNAPPQHNIPSYTRGKATPVRTSAVARPTSHSTHVGGRSPRRSHSDPQHHAAPRAPPRRHGRAMSGMASAALRGGGESLVRPGLEHWVWSRW